MNRAVISLLLALVPAVAATQQVDPHFKLEKLADGVYAAVRTDPPGWGANANNLFIIDNDGVVVVDTDFGPSSTKDVLKALRVRRRPADPHTVRPPKSVRISPS